MKICYFKQQIFVFFKGFCSQIFNQLEWFGVFYGRIKVNNDRDKNIFFNLSYLLQNKNSKSYGVVGIVGQ